MLGFGFKKTKVLASAEKNVKQGKLNQAIADYTKIAQEDPHDLNVLNTIGDLYVRVGDVDQATVYFKRVGDAYAAEGYTVKAIAVYKKLTKQNPNAIEVVSKLAELYGQQGFNTDARAQYTIVADHCLRRGDNQAAIAALRKAVELDPNHPQTLARLAQVHIQLGNKSDARDVYFRSAQALRTRGALEACDEALNHALQLSPGFGQAILLRGEIRLETGNAKGAVECLESLPDVDSRPECLRMLLRAHLQLAHYAEAEALARKLLAVSRDLSGVTLYAEALMRAGDFEGALRFYREHAAALLAADTPAVLQTLYSMITPLKSNSQALIMLCELLEKAGDTTQVAEITELLAHASVQEGALHKARDLYKKLAAMEPENPLHLQNYQQVLARLGEQPPAREFTLPETSRPQMSEELETKAAPVEQKYSLEINSALREAFTDSELFASYNLPERAVQPLEAVLPRVPRNVEVNQRLASLYLRIGRLAEAAQRCQVLKSVFAEAGFQAEARRYSDLEKKYASGTAVEQTTIATDSSSLHASGGNAGQAAVGDTRTELLDSSGQNTSGENVLPTPEMPANMEDLDSSRPAGREEAQSPVPPVFERADGRGAAAAIPAFIPSEMPPEATSAGEALAHEIDLSEEWERVLAGEQAGTTPEPAAEPGGSPADTAVTMPSLPMDPALADILEEVRFYISQSMMAEARMAMVRAEAHAPDAPELAELRAQLAAFRGEDPQQAIIEILSEVEPVDDQSEFPPVGAGLNLPSTPDVAGTDLPAVSLSLQATEAETAAGPEAESHPSLPARESAQEPPSFRDGKAAVTEAPDSSSSESKPASGVLDDFVLKLEESLGTDYAVPRPPAAPPRSAQAEPRAESGQVAAPHPAASGDQLRNAGPGPSLPGEPRVAEPPAAPGANIDESAAEASNDESIGLAGLFTEFKRDMESSSAGGEDPETHYNLGVAFKEMGLFDEAIGEFQKVCKAIEQHSDFPQVIQVYTWLADCFLQSGVPEAAIHWYEKTLQIPNLGEERGLAVHYELACAYEAAGDLAAARRHFMHVLSRNIDYRDVAERIKALKS